MILDQFWTTSLLIYIEGTLKWTMLQACHIFILSLNLEFFLGHIHRNTIDGVLLRINKVLRVLLVCGYCFGSKILLYSVVLHTCMSQQNMAVTLLVLDYKLINFVNYHPYPSQT
ncbi:hypothetical protein S245_037972 [Arachis hypogaea]|nr:uncharacterized protein DS421_11g343620 [Arachis hypogaea]